MVLWPFNHFSEDEKTDEHRISQSIEVGRENQKLHIIWPVMVVMNIKMNVNWCSHMFQPTTVPHSLTYTLAHSICLSFRNTRPMREYGSIADQMYAFDIC